MRHKGGWATWIAVAGLCVPAFGSASMSSGLQGSSPIHADQSAVSTARVPANAVASASKSASTLSPPAPAGIEVQVSGAIVSLPGPWQFSPGDSPIQAGSFEWAQPHFDDRRWATMDLHSTPGSTDPYYGTPDYVPGWSAKGYPDLTGFAWYRLRLHIAASNFAQPLALKMPDHVDDAYQVFANGQYLGAFGDFRKDGVGTYRTRPLTFRLPKPNADGDLVLAVRFYVEPIAIGYGTTPDGGGMLEAPLVGLPDATESVRLHEAKSRVLVIVFPVFVGLTLLIAAIGAGWLWLLDRRSPAYLYLMLALLFSSLGDLSDPLALLTYRIRSLPFGYLVDLVATLSLASWIYFWRHWFNLVKNRWRPLVVGALTLTLAFVEASVDLTDTAPLAYVRLGVHLVLIGNAALVAIVLLTLAEGYRRDRTAAMLALPPILLLAIGVSSQQLLDLLNWNSALYLYGVQIEINDIASVLLVLTVAILVARRFVSTQVAERLERQSIDQDLEQASELQQKVIIPEVIRSPHFSVESEYRPARTVGGDFFQVILGDDGSLLVVVGDVSGKGVPAAMLVAVLVGALRTRADISFEPAAILKTLNDRLVGRSGGHFATCLVAHITPDGTMQIANAGHIPPYSAGAPLPIEGSIPLGIAAGMEYDVQNFSLNAGQTLTFVTDGVLEARNYAGELFGFSRLARLSTLSPSDIADTAVEFGQDDDITVLGVRFHSAELRHEPLHRATATPVR